MMDWKAAMSSEIFREYVKNELAKEAIPKKVDESEVLNEYKRLSQKINSNPELLRAFKALREKFASDPEYRAQVDPNFVNGVNLLILCDEEF